MEKKTTKIGFLGIGSMGFAMCYGLHKSGYRMVLPSYRRNRDILKGYSELAPDKDTKNALLEEMLQNGAEPAESQGDLIKASDILVTSLPTSKQVEDLVYASDGILSCAKEGTIVIDTTTADPSSTRRVAASLEAKGISFLDAPVSGGTRGAAGQTLSIMVGGKKDVFDRVLPLLHTLGSPEKVYYMGESGAGNTIKIVNNCLSAAHIATATEALLVAAKAGISPEKALEVINVSGGRSVVTTERMPNIVLQGKKFNFSMAMMRKDVALYEQITKDMRVATPVNNLAGQIWHVPTTEEGDDSAEDISSFIKRYECWIGARIFGVNE